MKRDELLSRYVKDVCYYEGDDFEDWLADTFSEEVDKCMLGELEPIWVSTGSRTLVIMTGALTYCGGTKFYHGVDIWTLYKTMSWVCVECGFCLSSYDVVWIYNKTEGSRTRVRFEHNANADLFYTKMAVGL